MSTVLTQRLWSAFRFNQPSIRAGDADLAGSGVLSGVVRVSGEPASRTVEIRDEATLLLAGAVVSDIDGTWSVSGLTTIRPLRAIILGSTGERDVTIRGLYAAAPP
jgi:hypothetical protein